MSLPMQRSIIIPLLLSFSVLFQSCSNCRSSPRRPPMLENGFAKHGHIFPIIISLVKSEWNKMVHGDTVPLPLPLSHKHKRRIPGLGGTLVRTSFFGPSWAAFFTVWSDRAKEVTRYSVLYPSNQISKCMFTSSQCQAQLKLKSTSNAYSYN